MHRIHFKLQGKKEKKKERKKERRAHAFTFDTGVGQYEMLNLSYELTRIKRNKN
jgi:hypothetical protein